MIRKFARSSAFLLIAAICFACGKSEPPIATETETTLTAVQISTQLPTEAVTQTPLIDLPIVVSQTPSAASDCNVNEVSHFVVSVVLHYRHVMEDFYSHKDLRPHLQNLDNLQPPRCAIKAYDATIAFTNEAVKVVDEIRSGDVTSAQAETALRPFRTALASALSDLRSNVLNDLLPTQDPPTEIPAHSTHDLRPLFMLSDTHRSFPRCASFSEDARVLLMDYRDRADLWLPSTGEKIASINITGLCRHSQFSYGNRYLIFSIDYFANPFPEYPILIWDFKPNKMAYALPPNLTYGIAAFDRLSTDIAILVHSRENNVHLYELSSIPQLFSGELDQAIEDPDPIHTWQIPRDIDPFGISYTSSIPLLAMVDSEGQLFLADSLHNEVLRRVDTHPTSYAERDRFFTGPTALAVSADGTSVAWGSPEVSLSLYNSLEGSTVALGDPLLLTYSASFSNSGDRLLTGGFGDVQVWDVVEQTEVCRLVGGDGSIVAVSYDREEQDVYGVSSDYQLYKWHLLDECLP